MVNRRNRTQSSGHFLFWYFYYYYSHTLYRCISHQQQHQWQQQHTTRSPRTTNYQSSVTVNQSDRFSYTTVWFEVTIRAFFFNIYIQNANIYTSTSGFRDKQTLKHRRSTSAHCFPSNPLKFAQLVKPFPLKWNPQKVHFICIVSFKPPVFQVKYRTHDFLYKEHNTICA